MKRMMGLADAWTSSMTERRRFSNSPFMLAPAESRPMSSTCSDTSLELRRHVALGETEREAFDDRRLADARLAGEDGVVLPAAHEDVDDLPDLFVAAGNRVELALPRPLGEVDRVALERLLLAHRRRRDGAARLAGLAGSRRARAAAVAGAHRVLGGAADDAREVGDEVVGADLVELAEIDSKAPCRRGVLSRPTSRYPVRTCRSPKRSEP
jgi:hypothetical protein